MNLMRKILLILGAVALLPALANAQMSEGTVKVFSVRGDVNLVNKANGRTQPLQRGMEFSDGTQGMQVVTGANSTALLLFSNGSAVTVQPQSEFTVNEFLQADFDPAAGTFLRLTEDPSVSKTDLYLEDGTIAGQVKRLQEGSEYVVNTPTGSAGIRGTDYVVTVTQSGGQTFTTITNASGDVVAISEGNPFSVPVGESVTISADRVVDSQGNVTYNVTDVSAPQPATAEQLQTANSAVQEIQQAEQQTPPPAPNVPGQTAPTTPEVDIDPDINVSPAGG